MAVALSVLAMTVGLIRAETTRDLRMLTATGATASTRRALTGATAGALGLLGGFVGAAGAYTVMLAANYNDAAELLPVPVVHLLVIMVGLPLVAAAAGWILARGEVPATTRPAI
jgi:putative ABC transport system permease protein